MKLSEYNSSNENQSVEDHDDNLTQNSSSNEKRSKKKKIHDCPYCNRSFTRPYRLNDHVSFTHTGEKKYLCEICSKHFSCKDKYKHHFDVKHNGTKKSSSKTKNTADLICNFPGCARAFANKYNVKRHIENVHLKLKRKVKSSEN